VSLVVVVADQIAAQGLALLDATEGMVVRSTVGYPERLPEQLRPARALIVRSETRVTRELIEQAPELTVIARAGIGVDNIDVQAATERGVAVFNAPDGNTVSAAEHTIALMLALSRRVPWAAESMRVGEWDRKRFQGHELYGKTLGIVGLGRIGQRVMQLARAFDMTVVGYDPYLAEHQARALRVELDALDDLLRRADIVTLHVPLTDQTRWLINRERLRLMKPAAVLINTARGGLVDEAALAEALESGGIAGAALDVFDREPLAQDSPLRRAGPLVMTPHLAASTSEAQQRVSLMICEAVRRVLLGGDLNGAVNASALSGVTGR
jgi:D-3-phosphoglycerate dehydrogenase